MNNNYFFRFFKVLMLLLLCLISPLSKAAETYNKDWTVASIIGSFSKKSSFKYFLEPQLRLIETSSVFNQLLLVGGLGYQISPDIIVIFGMGWIKSKSLQKVDTQEKRIVQQLNWRIPNNLNWNINSRTRFEEREQLNLAPRAVRFRERLWIRIPFKHWDTYSLSSYDEIFFNLNHPRWVSSYPLEQNRFFIGISKKASKSMIIDFGYMNQYLQTSRRFLDNVLLLSFTINT